MAGQRVCEHDIPVDLLVCEMTGQSKQTAIVENFCLQGLLRTKVVIEARLLRIGENIVDMTFGCIFTRDIRIPFILGQLISFIEVAGMRKHRRDKARGRDGDSGELHYVCCKAFCSRV